MLLKEGNEHFVVFCGGAVQEHHNTVAFLKKAKIVIKKIQQTKSKAGFLSGANKFDLKIKKKRVDALYKDKEIVPIKQSFDSSTLWLQGPIDFKVVRLY